MSREIQLLVDFYNIELTRQGEEDKPIIMDFFEKYAPEVLKYQTSAEIEELRERISIEKQALRSVKDAPPQAIEKARRKLMAMDTLKRTQTLLDALKRAALRTSPELYLEVECGGTLGWFDHTHNQSWFRSEEIKNFYRLHQLIHYIVDSIVEKQALKGTDLIMLEQLLLSSIKLSLVVKEKATGEELDIIPGLTGEVVNPEEYDFTMKFRSISKTKGNNLALGSVKYDLLTACMDIMGGHTQLDRCQLDGCTNVFMIRPSGKRQKYCSDSHRVLAHRRRKEEAAVLP